MMGRIDNQMQLLILDLDSMIPENHLLRQIKNSVNFDFIVLLRLTVTDLVYGS